MSAFRCLCIWPISISTCLSACVDTVLLIIIWAKLSSVPVKSLWNADSSGQRKSNIPLYLFNESDLLSSLYLLPYCRTSFLSLSVTLLRNAISFHCLSPILSRFPSIFNFDSIRRYSRCLKVITTYLLLCLEPVRRLVNYLQVIKGTHRGPQGLISLDIWSCISERLAHTFIS